MTASTVARGYRRAAAIMVVLLAMLALAPVPDSLAQARTHALPLGDPDLSETRTRETLAAGVRLIRIVRGTKPAQTDEIPTTTRGPWRVSVLRIDPSKAQGHLETTFGPNLAQVEKTTELVRFSGALAGVNASFFSIGTQYPGDPVGLALHRGQLLSEPAAAPAEVDLVLNAKTSNVLLGRLQWSGVVKNRRTEVTLQLEFLNHPPVVPAGCAALVKQRRCTAAGDVARFTREFGRSTPSGYGVEVVLGRRGCVVRTSTTRGTALAAGQTSLQATGRDTVSLQQVAKGGCVNQRVTLADENGDHLALGPAVFGVNGRYRLVSNGQIVERAGQQSFFDRNPRTIAGTTRDGTIVLATIDGRQSVSVGTTMKETAAVAKSLGMYDALNLDGGGSTTMSVDGRLVNRPSDQAGERAVGDALVYVDEPAS